MAELPWNKDLIEFIISHRIAVLTPIFTFFTFFGDLEGYIIIIAAVYVAYDKKVGYRLAMVVLTSNILNHLLKIIIRNPRPFVTEGSYSEKWIVSDPDELALSFSTPSGHSMSGMTFWMYLRSKVTNKKLRYLFIFFIFMIGVSRPYLGVHYVEDILLGWFIGFLLVITIIKWENNIVEYWSNMIYRNKVIITVLVSILIWVTAGLVFSWNVDAQEFATNTGFITGFIVARDLEIKRVNFDSRSKGAIHKLLRYLLTIVFTIATLEVLDIVFSFADDDTPIGFILRYVRYCFTAFNAVFVAPLVFTKIGLANENE